MRPTAYAYSRFSNAAQSEGDSLRRQLKASYDFAEKFDLELDTTLRDLGVSAFKGVNRIKGALGSFISRVNSGEIEKGSYLLVDSMDRFSRESETQVLNMLTGLTLAGIKVVNVSEEHVLDETATVFDYIRVLIAASRSHQESTEKSRKVRLAREQERKNARDHLVPFSPAGPHWLQLVSGVWQPLPERVAIVRRLFDLKEAGLGNQHIAQTFNGEGVPTPRGKGKWFNSTVGDLAASIAVVGHYQPHTGKGATRKAVGEPIQNFYPAIIDKSQFYRVQNITAGRRNPNARPATKDFPNLLVGLVTCGSCGGVVGFLKSTFPHKPNWSSAGVLRCNGVARGLCDNRTRIRYADLEADLLPFISTLPLSPKRMVQPDEISALEADRAALAAKIETLLDLAEQGGAIGDRLRQREMELSGLDRRLADERARVSQARAATPTGDALAELQQLQRDMVESTGDRRYAIRAKINNVLGQVVTGGFVMDGSVIVARVHPFAVVGKIATMATATTGRRLRWEIASVSPKPTTPYVTARQRLKPQDS